MSVITRILSNSIPFTVVPPFDLKTSCNRLGRAHDVSVVSRGMAVFVGERSRGDRATPRERVLSPSKKKIERSKGQCVSGNVVVRFPATTGSIFPTVSVSKTAPDSTAFPEFPSVFRAGFVSGRFHGVCRKADDTRRSPDKPPAPPCGLGGRLLKRFRHN